MLQPPPPCPASTHLWQIRASGPCLHWQLCIICVCVCVCVFPTSCVALWDSRTPHRQACESVFYYVKTSPSWLPPQVRSLSLTLLSLRLLYFVLPLFKDNGLPCWVPSVLPQCSEVVLWKLPSIQMIFSWICGGESGLSTLFLHHLGTTPKPAFFKSIKPINACHSTFKKANPSPWHQLGKQMFWLFLA